MKDKHRILVTGGAGFIGSNIVEALLKLDNIEYVRVLDNLATGSLRNLEEFSQNAKLEFIEGDIRDFATCQEAVRGIDLISHQAALGSVPRSINDPQTTNEVNITGTLNVFIAAKEAKIPRVVYAASSSSYGDSPYLPKREDVTGKPISPYSVTKLVNELYAHVFGNLYDINFIGLRYFNIFGPKQDPNGAYAAVIPLFIKAMMDDTPITINGDGQHSRDFTFVSNAVLANIKALFTDRKDALNEIYNIATNERTTLIELYDHLKNISGSQKKPIFGPPRLGDVKHSLADISKAMNYLGYQPAVRIKEGLQKTFDWYTSDFNSTKKEQTNSEVA
ncbi:MAG: SDR family oxidoreductase [Bacteroidota bacterium]